MKDIQKVIDKYFGEERVLYFHQSDKHISIAGDPYLKYINNGEIELWFGCSDGESCIMITEDANKLEQIIRLIIGLQ